MPDPANQPDDQAWQQLLEQLRAQPVPAPRPFFYTRLQARLAESRPARRPVFARWLQRPAYAAVLGLLMLVLHADSVSGSADTSRQGPQTAGPRFSAP